MTRARLLALGFAGVLCVDVRIDQSAYLDCLNELFRSAAKPPAHDDITMNPAAIPAPAAGTYNQAAIREMLGQSFGHGVIPQRPAPPVYTRLPR
jgi:hypothetical protein